jgi:hypothetical protein
MNSERQPGAPGPDEKCETKLLPIEPPGRVTRKARRFEAEIAQLRAQGYSLDAIRRALAGAGVQVSISTVRREAIRHAAPAATGASVRGAQREPRPLTAGHALRPAEAAGPAALADEVSGKDQAEAFLRSQITNTLLRAKEDP